MTKKTFKFEYEAPLCDVSLLDFTTAILESSPYGDGGQIPDSDYYQLGDF